MTTQQRWILVDEELHLVDRTSRRPVRRAREVLEVVGQEGFDIARHGALVTSCGGQHTALADLDAGLRERRSRIVEAGRGLGLGVLAAGALASPDVELDVDPDEPDQAPGHEFRTRADARFRVTVEVADRDEAQWVARRVAGHVPALLALAASSPFRADGSDSGYASCRVFEACWSPTHLAAVRVDSAEEFDAAVDALVATGVVADRELVDVDVRPAPDRDGVQLRVCDSCSTVDTIVLVAALFRALVERVLASRVDAASRKGAELEEPAPTVLAAATWRAARSGLEGDLVDLADGVPHPSSTVVDTLVELVTPQLEASGDLEKVRELLEGVRGSGTSATRQRATLRRRGRIRDVIDLLAAETSGAVVPRSVVDDTDMRRMLDSYSPLGEAVVEEVHDEAITPEGEPRPEYVELLKSISDLGPDELNRRKAGVEEGLREKGVTLKVYGRSEPQVYPLDVAPRILSADQWARIAAGIEQRGRAMEMFLRDVYGPGEILETGIVTREMLDRTPGFLRSGRSVPEGAMHAPICGVDLISTAPGEWVVLEDNLRMPGGMAVAVGLRDTVTDNFPEFSARAEIWDPREALTMLRQSLEACAPEGTDEVSITVVVAEDELGSYDLRTIAEFLDAAIVTPQQLVVSDGELLREEDGEKHRVHVLYVRMDEEELLDFEGTDGERLRRPLLDAVEAATVAVCNAPGNGVADDKAMYALVPKLVEHYLGEPPLIGQVDTYLCSDRAQREQVLDRIGELVVKPIDGYGGSGITVGPECARRELDERVAEIRRHPERFIAQEVQALSTLPTFDGRQLQRRHVDMRAFALLRPDGHGGILADAAPVALTRVAPAGTMVVNASSGGGGKDTWIQRA